MMKSVNCVYCLRKKILVQGLVPKEEEMWPDPEKCPDIADYQVVTSPLSSRPFMPAFLDQCFHHPYFQQAALLIVRRLCTQDGRSTGSNRYQDYAPHGRVLETLVQEIRKVKLEEELSKSRGGWVVETRWEGGDNDHDHDGGGEEAQETAVALLDTGSAVMVTPDFDTARRLYGSMSRDIRPIDSLGSWGVECEVWEKMGRDVKFVVGGSGGEKVEVVVKKEFLNVGEYPGQPGICQGLFLHPLTQAREPLRGRPAWIFGNALLRGYVTVWNWEEMSVGFGKVRENPEEKKRCGRKASR